VKNFAPSAQSNRQLILGWPLLFVLFLVTGCGNSASNSGPTAEYKVVNALTNSSAVSVLMDGKVVGTDLSYPDAVGPLLASGALILWQSTREALYWRRGTLLFPPGRSPRFYSHGPASSVMPYFNLRMIRHPQRTHRGCSEL